MKKAERFALMEWLSEFPNDKTYDEIYNVMADNEDVWMTEGITAWEVVEHHTTEQVADMIDSTRAHFNNITEPLVSALEGAIRLAQENRPDMIDDPDFDDRLNGLLAVLADWKENK